MASVVSNSVMDWSGKRPTNSVALRSSCGPTLRMAGSGRAAAPRPSRARRRSPGDSATAPGAGHRLACARGKGIVALDTGAIVATGIEPRPVRGRQPTRQRAPGSSLRGGLAMAKARQAGCRFDVRPRSDWSRNVGVPARQAASGPSCSRQMRLASSADRGSPVSWQRLPAALRAWNRQVAQTPKLRRP